MSTRLPMADRLRIASKMGMASTFRLEPDEAEAFADLLDHVSSIKDADNRIKTREAIHAAQRDKLQRLEHSLSWWMYSVALAILAWATILEAYK
jgi:hypothetical protein